MKRSQRMMNDVIFKFVFGSSDSEPVLRDLLNGLLNRRGDDRITEVEIENPGIQGVHASDKDIELDIRARDARGRLYNIEVQVSDDTNFKKRSVFYLARLHAQQLAKGADYSDITQSIAICILDFTLFPERPRVQSVYRLRERFDGEELVDDIEMRYIELTKFNKRSPHELEADFDRWVHVLKYGELYEKELAEVPAELRAVEAIPMAIDRMRRARASTEVRLLIEAREKFELDHASRLAQARRDGLAEGLAEGLAKGLAEGLAKGKAEGKAEEVIEMGRRMLAEGVAPDLVLRVTGVPLTELEG
jgi:predicted transposase/invertase (TIGR01784 family)